MVRLRTRDFAAIEPPGKPDGNLRDVTVLPRTTLQRPAQFPPAHAFDLLLEAQLGAEGGPSSAFVMLVLQSPAALNLVLVPTNYRLDSRVSFSLIDAGQQKRVPGERLVPGGKAWDLPAGRVIVTVGYSFYREHVARLHVFTSSGLPASAA